jgi:hypothetical protein
VEDFDGVLGIAPAVAALVALRLAERPEPLHLARSLGQSPDGAR